MTVFYWFLLLGHIFVAKALPMSLCSQGVKAGCSCFYIRPEKYYLKCGNFEVRGNLLIRPYSVDVTCTTDSDLSEFDYPLDVRGVLNYEDINTIHAIDCFYKKNSNFNKLANIKLNNGTRNLLIDNNKVNMVYLTQINKSEEIENLSTIYFSSSNFVIFGSNALENLTLLEKIDVNNNKIVFFPKLVLPNLVKLYLRSNKNLGLLQDSFAGFSNLIHLEIANNNNLDCLFEKQFIELDRLHTLRLSGNALKTLPWNLFQVLENLNLLHISNNLLESLDQKVFIGLKNLEDLDLSYNKLTTLVPNLFRGLRRLIILKLSHNHLQQLDQNTFLDLYELVELDLSVNQLDALPDNLFRELGKLQKFLCYFCNLKTLPSRLFERTMQITYLDLSANKLSNLPRDFFANLYNPNFVNLQNNPLNKSGIDIYFENRIPSFLNLE